MDGERKREETSDDGENRMNHVSSFVFALCRSRHDFSSSPCVERESLLTHFIMEEGQKFRFGRGVPFRSSRHTQSIRETAVNN